MSRRVASINERAGQRRLALRAQLEAKFPALAPASAVCVPDPSAIVLGRNERAEPQLLSVRARLEHMLAIGTTGGGKTKFMEHCARQDVAAGRGVCIIDPHAGHPQSIYKSFLSWLHARGYTKTRTVHIIDPNAPTHVTGINPLELPDADYQPSVIADAMQEAIERMWGEEDLNGKPTLQRVLWAILTALTELNLTLAEARLLFDPQDRDGIRAWVIANVSNEEVREELEWLHQIAADPRGSRDFRLETTGPRNRLSKLNRDDALRFMVGQTERTIDFRAALDEGHIILANLSPGPRAGDKTMQLLGRLLTRLLFFHAVRRKHPERAYFLYLDECQLFLSGDISRTLAEARKYGLGTILATQSLAGLRNAAVGVLDAIQNLTNTKVVMRLKNPEEAAELADMVFDYDLEIPVRALIRPTVVGHRIARLWGESKSEQQAVAHSRSQTVGQSTTESKSYTYAESDSAGESESGSESETLGISSGTSAAELSGMSHGSSIASVPGTDFFAMPATVGMTQATGAHGARSQGTQEGESRASSKTSARGSSRSHATSEAWSEAVAHTASIAQTAGITLSKAQSTSAGWRETFEPVLEDRASSVHGLENVRYKAASALRQLVAGRAAISFVDTGGMRCAALQIANVENYALPELEFAKVQEEVLTMSTSATPAAAAAANIEKRRNALRAHAASATAEPETPAGFRTQRKRKAIVKPSVELHGERSAPERTPVKGRDRLRRRP